VCDNDAFVDQAYPTKVLARIREESCGPRSAAAVAREEILASNFPKMIAAGARLVLGTDAGIDARHTFGWADHHEIARWVQLGLSPSQAIVAATGTPAELLGIKDMGTLAVGKSADFVVLNANPLDNIRDTRRIADVYLHGVRLDREALLAAWKARN
jgi:imidazolonepropionase-like amidohydrolase